MNTNGKNEWVYKQINKYQREEWMGEYTNKWIPTGRMNGLIHK